MVCSYDVVAIFTLRGDNKKRVSTSEAINQGVGQIWGRDGNSSGMIKGVFER